MSSDFSYVSKSCLSVTAALTFTSPLLGLVTKTSSSRFSDDFTVADSISLSAPQLLFGFIRLHWGDLTTSAEVDSFSALLLKRTFLHAFEVTAALQLASLEVEEAKLEPSESLTVVIVASSDILYPFDMVPYPELLKAHALLLSC